MSKAKQSKVRPEYTITYDSTSPDLRIFALLAWTSNPAIKVLKRANAAPSVAHLSTARSVSGLSSVLKALSRLQSGVVSSPADALDTVAIDALIDASLTQFTRLDNSIGALIEATNTHLAHCTYLVEGAGLSAADIAVWSALRGNQRWRSFARRVDDLPHIVRWFRMVDALPLVQRALADVEAAGAGGAAAAASKGGKKGSKKGGKKGSKKGSAVDGSGESSAMKLVLPNAKMGQVVTRFPPEPSGYLHIGHVKACLLNDFFARAYKGKLILRFDDTNPAKEKQEFVDNIHRDLHTLGVEYGEVTHTSDWFEEILVRCAAMIKDGKAYVDDTPVDVMREQRAAGEESARRSQSVEENLRMWDEMVRGTEAGAACVVRAKINMQHDNYTMRDPAMYRVVPGAVHHRTGDKYKVYPTYDFACPIVDSLEGVTHTLRTNEYRMRNEQYFWFIDAMGLRKPDIWDYSRLNFTYTVLSKRKLQWFVDQGLVEGWHDPRFPTVQGIMRRGVTIDALREFIYATGPSQAVNNTEWDKFWAFNKKVIDPIAHRFSAVRDEDGFRPARLVITNPADGKLPADGSAEDREVNLHPKDKAQGTKLQPFGAQVLLEQEDAASIEAGEEVTLLILGNVIVDEIERDDASGAVVSLKARLNPKGKAKNTKKKLHWVADKASRPLTKVTLVEFTHLITVEKLEGDVADVLTPQTIFETALVGEPALADVKQGQIVQLNRRGFCYCDQAYAGPDQPARLHFIPSGKQGRMSILSTKCVEAHLQA